MTITLKQLVPLKCESRIHCRTCRAPGPDASAWRASVAGVAEFDCPYGITAEDCPEPIPRPQRRGWIIPGIPPGDAVYHLARLTGIKRVVDYMVPGGCGCDDRRRRWNRAGWRGMARGGLQRGWSRLPFMSTNAKQQTPNP